MGPKPPPVEALAMVDGHEQQAEPPKGRKESFSKVFHIIWACFVVRKPLQA
jgi:hypothetical protein